MNEFGIKVQKSLLYKYNIREWESQLISFLRLKDLEQFVTKFTDESEDNTGLENFVEDHADMNKEESKKKITNAFRVVKLKLLRLYTLLYQKLNKRKCWQKIDHLVMLLNFGC